jgi:hypothetical protein
LELLLNGGLSPLQGFMNRADYDWYAHSLSCCCRLSQTSNDFDMDSVLSRILACRAGYCGRFPSFLMCTRPTTRFVFGIENLMTWLYF